jgi:hypothetical protein
MPFEPGGNLLALQLLGTLLVLVGMFGWGELAAAPFRWSRPRHWGSTLALGVGACVTVGGLLAWAEVISIKTNAAVVAIGVVAFGAANGARLLRRRAAAGDATPAASPGGQIRLDPLELALHAAAIAYLVVTALGATRPFWVDVHDDLPAYFEFPKRLLETGTFLEPMSSRRIATMGGAAYLQSLLYPLWGPAAVPLVDIGLGQLLAWSAALALRPPGVGRAARAVRLIAPIFVLWLASALMLYNHAPMRLAFGLVVALLGATVAFGRGGARSGESANGWDSARSGDFALLAATGAALVSLRNSFIGFAMIVACGWVVLGLARRDRRLALGAAAAGGAMVALLLPYFVVSWRSSRTPFYPLLEGTFRHGAFSPPLAFSGKVAFVGDALLRTGVPWIAVIAIGAWLIGWRTRGAAVGVVAAIATSAVTAFGLTGFDSYNLFRYSAPMLDGALAFAACQGGTVLAEGLVRGRAALAVPIGTAVALAVAVSLPLHLVLYESEEGFWRPYEAWRATAAFGEAAAQALREPFTPFASAGSEVYAAAQETIPRGSSVAAAVARPYLWNLARQRIDSIDIPGVASAPPGLPYLEGPEALVAYLRGLGYDFFAFTPPAFPGCLYDGSRWALLASGGFPMWRDLGRRVIDFQSNAEALAVDHPVVFASAEIVVLDLR